MKLKELQKKYSNYNLEGVVINGVSYVRIENRNGTFVKLAKLQNLK